MKKTFTFFLIISAFFLNAQNSNIYLTSEVQIWQNQGVFNPGIENYDDNGNIQAYASNIKGISQTAVLGFGIEQNGNFRLHAGFSMSQSHYLPKVNIASYTYGFGCILNDGSLIYMNAGTEVTKVHVTSIETPVGFDIRLAGKGKLRLWTSWQLSPTFITKRNVELSEYSYNWEAEDPLNSQKKSTFLTDKGVKISGGYIHTALRLEYYLTRNIRIYLAPQLSIIEHRDNNFFKAEGIGETYDATFVSSTLFAKNWGGSLGIARVF